MTKEVFADVLALIETNYSNQDGYSVEKIKLMRHMLDDIPMDILMLAVKMHIASSPFMPSVADLRENASEIMMGSLPSAIEAWGEVMDKISQRSFPKFTNPITARVVKAIGWRTIKMSTLPASERRAFIDGYNAIVKQEKKLSVMTPDVREALPASNQLRLLSKSPKQLEREVIREHEKQALLEAKNG